MSSSATAHAQRPLRLCILGLGAVGQRMLEQAAIHPHFEVVCGFDPSPQARQQALSLAPHLRCSDSAAASLDANDIDAVYVAAPPLHHAELVRQCVVRRLPVLCEKPLGVDLADSQALCQEMRASGLPQAVNFVFASAPAVGVLAQRLKAPDFALQQVFIRLHFHQWPRPFQAHAAWLSGAAQGGFTREVSSHFIYLLQRLLGPVHIEHAQIKRTGPEDAEQQLSALLRAGDIPVTLLSTTGGQPPEIVQAEFMGRAQTLALRDWYSLWLSDAQHPQGTALVNAADARTQTYQAQLDQWLAALQGQPHSLPDFEQALQVQTTIETLLRTPPQP